MGGEASDFFFDEGISAGVGGEFAVGRKFQAFFGEFGGNGGVIRDDEGDDEFALIANDHGVEDVRAGLEDVFDGLRSDEFSGGGFEQVFLAVGDKEVVVLVEIPDVAGLEPTVVGEHIASGFGRFEIALHDAGTLGEDFAVIGDADLYVGDGAAGAADTVFRIVGGEDGRGFRQTVALIDGDADGPEKFGEVLGERRAAGEDDAKLAAGASANFGVDEFVGKKPFQAKRKAGGFFAAAPGGGFAGGLHSEIVDFFEEARNGGEDGGVEFEESLRDVFDDIHVSDGAAVKKIDVVEHAAVDVGEREKRDSQVGFWAETELVAGVGDIGAEIGVREHDALGLTGGARGVNKRGELAGENLGSAEAVGGNFRWASGGD